MSDPDPEPQPAGLLTAVAEHRVPKEEVRFGVILNGGVSLAVWMGGSVLEVDRLTRAARKAEEGPDGEVDPVYDALLALCGATARADVIAGTSAGGINGAALALSQVNDLADIGLLRNIWSDQGRIEALLRQPFKGSPASLLQGDEYFLPSLNLALGRLASPAKIRDPEAAPIDLTITTTVLRGNQSVTVDSLGQRLPQTLHGGRFRWQRYPDKLCEHLSAGALTGALDFAERRCARCDPFSEAAVQRTAHRLALASRCTASFPVAFEPVFVPVGSPLHTEPESDDVSALTDEERLRPDMDFFVSDWGDASPARDRSRFVVDGGVLANTPTRAALEAVQAMPADGPVRRVMLLIYPHAGQPDVDAPDQHDSPPSVVGALSGLLGALTAQGSRTFVDELEQHNRFAAGRRGVRNDILSEMLDAGELQELASAIYRQYQRLRRWRAGRDLAERAVGFFSPDDGSSVRHDDTWGYERIRSAARQAQEDWKVLRQDDGPYRPQVPYFPNDLPQPDAVEPPGRWAWGVTTAIGIADAAADLLRRLVWVLGDDQDVAAARRAVSKLSTEIRHRRRDLDAMWEEPPLTTLEPNESYWMLRLASYERLMLGWPDGSVAAAETEFDSLIEGVRAHWEGAGPRPTADQLRKAIAEQQPGAVGAAVRHLVDEVLEQLLVGLRALPGEARTQPDVLGDHRVELDHWRKVLRPGDEVPSREELLHLMLLLEVVSTALGDEATTGADIPVEIVQLSAHTRNAFTEYTQSADDKLGGWSLNRFGGFVKRSWRINDWTWGRVDAATVLCRTLLHPARVRRAAVLSHLMPSSPDGDAGQPDAGRLRAVATVNEILTQVFPDGVPTDPRLGVLRDEAVAELTDVFTPSHRTGDLPSSLPHLADIFAWALHLRIVPDELPALAGAIRADRVDGANARSRGETFLEEHGELLRRLSAPSEDRPAARDQVAALSAFDRAGIGREPWNQEVSSDLIIRSATTAAAVAATVVDSDRSGLGVVKPVTRLMRGGMLLPYWTVTGLTSRATLPRTLALLALSLGGTVLALALFGVLPETISGPATALGVSAVLVAFAYGAMRSGTMLHGLMLLTPVIALVAGAIARLHETSDENEAAAQQGIATMVVVLVLAVALIILGSIPATTGSVWATLDRLADRLGVPPLTEADGARRRFDAIRRRSEGVLRALLTLVPAVILFILLGAVTWWIAGNASVEEARSKVRDVDVNDISSPVWLAVLLVAALGLGAVYSHLQGNRLQVLQRSGTKGSRVWTYARVVDPAGAAAGWAVVYGAGYLGLALVLVWRPAGEPPDWAAALLVSSLLLGVFLIAVAPFLLPRNALARFERLEENRALETPEPASYAIDLVDRGLAYRALVKRPGLERGEKPRLTQRGRRLENRLRLTRLRTPAAAAKTKVLIPSLILAVLLVVGLVVVNTDVAAQLDRGTRTNITTLAAVVALVAAGVAFVGRRRLGVLLDSGGPRGLEFENASPLPSPWGAAAKALGLVLFYAAVAAFAYWNPGEVLGGVSELLAVGAVLLGTFHALFVPSWTNRSLLAWTEELEVARARDVRAEAAVEAAVAATRAADSAKAAATVASAPPTQADRDAVAAAAGAAADAEEAATAARAKTSDAETRRAEAEQAAGVAETAAKRAEAEAKVAKKAADRLAKAAEKAADGADRAADRVAAAEGAAPEADTAAAEAAADSAAEAAADAAQADQAAATATEHATETAQAADAAAETLRTAARRAAAAARTEVEYTANAALATATAAAANARAQDYAGARAASRAAGEAASRAGEAAAAAYALSLVHRQRAYRAFVRPSENPGGRPPKLTRQGRKLLARVKRSIRTSARQAS